MKDAMPRPQSCRKKPSQQVHNCAVQHDSAVMFRMYVQEAVGVQKLGGGREGDADLCQDSPTDWEGLDYMTCLDHVLSS